MSSIPKSARKSNVIPLPERADPFDVAADLFLRTRNMSTRYFMEQTLLFHLTDTKKDSCTTKSGITIKRLKTKLKIYPEAVSRDGKCVNCGADLYSNGSIRYVYPAGYNHEVIWSCGGCSKLQRTFEQVEEDD